MSLRSFIFCDFCNPDGVRTVDHRRRGPRPFAAGRRRDDGRAWIEAGEAEAVRAYGWARTAAGGHLCPQCRQRLSLRPPGGGPRAGAPWPPARFRAV